MGVIVNYWLLFTPSFEASVVGVLPIVKDRDPRTDGGTVSTQSVEFPLLNHMREDTKRLLRHFPRRYGGDFAPGLWNCMVRADGLHALTAMREELQLWMATYPANFDVGGCWDFHTGQPIGGVGSPWFDTSAKLVDFLPPKPPDLVAGMLWDVILGAGQAKRVFSITN